MTTCQLRFEFEYGAGGCLWADNEIAKNTLGCGPVDASFSDLKEDITKPPKVPLLEATRAMIDEIDFLHSGYLNPIYPPDPSLWLQSLCDLFNQKVDILIGQLRKELEPAYNIVDAQRRYTQDPRLVDYLVKNSNVSAMTSVEKPSMHWTHATPDL